MAPGNQSGDLGAVELASGQIAEEVGFTALVDPFKPSDLVPPPGVTSRPPACPICQTFLFPIDMNGAGDMLFECLNGDGHYETVFRVASNTYEPRPNIERPDWKPPLFKSNTAANVGLSADEEAVLAELLRKKQVAAATKVKGKTRTARVVKLRRPPRGSVEVKIIELTEQPKPKRGRKT